MDSVPSHSGGDDVEHRTMTFKGLYGTSIGCRQRARANDWIFGDKQGLLTSRSTYPGAGKYAGTLLADNHSNWPDMQRSIPAMLEFGLFGIPYVGASICGFHGNAGEELCQRWMQLGAFYPLCWNHNAQDQTPQDPSYFSGDMQQASLTAMHVRYSLLPYLYTLFHHAHVRGHSVARPLLNEFSNDPNTYDIDRQFMWGPGLLISPALDQGSTNVRAYFPPGLWYDYYTATKVRQGLRTLKTPLDRVNIHFRGGYIVPGQVPGNTTQFSRKNVMRLFVALDHAERASGELYWDDGETKDAYEKGEYLSVKFTCSSEQLRWTAEHNSLRGERLHVGFIDILGMPHYPRRILIDGATVLKPGQYEWQSSTNFLAAKSGSRCIQ
ncbi:PREDICTED: maltase-glucoamylase, intestinal-like [Priapulus caudatus]|uniref:Maltase-glucoamylase, intestinal-like n=1 Tax=Priapulus caudatus TaxID=37621 RepID=A0ABM1EIX5_PRICU|nr:PREDICTED: maltase-glucoamylase, intestinal-like [Priapulus caudatus]